MGLTSCLGLPSPGVDRGAMDAFRRVDAVVEFADGEGARRVSALEVEGQDASTLVLYLHGTPGDAEGWAAYLADPIGGARSIAVDRPGFGDSDPRPLPSLQGQASAVAPFLRSAERVVVVGHSYGGPVALQIALDEPDRVVGVVVVAGSVAPDQEKLRWFNVLARAVRPMLPRDLRHANDEVWPLRADLERLAVRLPEIAAPVRIVHGTEDSLVPFANVPFLEGALKGSKSVETTVIEGAGHFILWEEAHVPAVRAAIRSLLEDADSRGGAH